MISINENKWVVRFEEYISEYDSSEDVVIGILDAFINSYIYGGGSIWLQNEYTDDTFVVTPNGIYLISERDKRRVYSSDKDYEKELITDIENNKDSFICFIDSSDIGDINIRKNIIESKLSKLKSFRPYAAYNMPNGMCYKEYLDNKRRGIS